MLQYTTDFVFYRIILAWSGEWREVHGPDLKLEGDRYAHGGGSRRLINVKVSLTNEPVSVAIPSMVIEQARIDAQSRS